VNAIASAQPEQDFSRCDLVVDVLCLTEDTAELKIENIGRTHSPGTAVNIFSRKIYQIAEKPIRRNNYWISRRIGRRSMLRSTVGGFRSMLVNSSYLRQELFTAVVRGRTEH
jgi:hypothetical protein